MSAPHPLFRSIAGAANRFRNSLSQAQAVQERRLRTILRHNAGTGYGKSFGFSDIRDSAEYRARVPQTTYGDLLPFVNKIAGGEAGVLTAGAVVTLEETSGSTGEPKRIPYTAAGLDAFRRALTAWLDDLATAFPAVASGRSYWAISPVARAPRTTPGGIPIGLPGDAAYLGENLAPLVAETLAVPPEIGMLADIAEWRDATCLHLLACEDLAFVSVWSPTFLSDLLAHLRSERLRLASVLEHGRDNLAPNASRAALARRVLADAEPDFRALWPRLELVSCWDQASSQPFADTLRHALRGVPLQGKGLLATEGVVSIPLSGTSMPVLAVDSGYYEFRDGAGRCLIASEVSAGSDYEVVMTTESGLYRYATGDRVRVHGFEGEAPLLEFIGRGAQVSDLCGEKFSEDFVTSGLASLRLRFALVAPTEAPRRGYSLFVDAAEVSRDNIAMVEVSVEQALCRNPQYAYARRLGQLAPLEVRRCVRPLETWLRAGLERGQRLSVVKPPVLSAEQGWASRFQGATP